MDSEKFSKLNLNGPIATFNIKTGKYVKLMLLKRLAYLIVFIILAGGDLLFYDLLIHKVINLTNEQWKIFRPASSIIFAIAIVVAIVGLVKGYTSFCGEIYAYRKEKDCLTFISGVMNDREKVVNIKVNKITKFHGYYCLTENYFRYVFVSLDFPIDEISKPMIQEYSEQTIEETK